MIPNIEKLHLEKRAKHYSLLKVGFLKAVVAKTDLLMNVMMMRELHMKLKSASGKNNRKSLLGAM